MYGTLYLCGKKSKALSPHPKTIIDIAGQLLQLISTALLSRQSAQDCGRDVSKSIGVNNLHALQGTSPDTSNHFVCIFKF